MNILIKKATVIDPRSPLNGKQTDVLITNGTIHSIGEDLSHPDAEVFEAPNLHLSPGWFDMRVNIPDPGHEYKEDLISAAKAASKGGITAFACTATSTPPRDTKADIEYVINRTRNLGVTIHPYGTVSTGREGKDIAELYDMFSAGAVAFSDDKRSIRDTGLLSRALLYSQKFGGLVAHFPYDKSLSPSGAVHEGIVSTGLGLKGIPAESEELAVARDLHIVRYTKGKLHFATISTSGAVKQIREARKEGLNVTAEVSAHQIALTDQELNSFETDFKVMPPLRNEQHRNELIEGLKSGTIDVIVSDHTPQDVEEKLREFEIASFGASGLQTLFSAARTATDGQLSLEKLISCISINPARILNIPLAEIKPGERANLTLFDPDKEYIFRREMMVSKSKNTPFEGKTLKGVPLGIINNGRFEKNEV